MKTYFIIFSAYFVGFSLQQSAENFVARCQGRLVDRRKCCTRDLACDEGEGDCEVDDECSGDLVCGHNNCKQFGDMFHPQDDCCEKPKTEIPISCSSRFCNFIVTTKPKNTEKRCQGRNVDKGLCCTPEDPCDEGEGDCDENDQCKPGLMCGSNNCQQFSHIFHEKDDCCIRMVVNNPDPAEQRRCQGRHVVQADGGKCCKPENPCDEGEGDCDGDDQCGAGLVCGNNNCKQFGDIFDEKDDCCVKPSEPKVPRCQGRNVDVGRCCTDDAPCDEGEGDCDEDSHCGQGLMCGNNNCKQFGDIFHPKDDCCVKRVTSVSSTNSRVPSEPKPGQRCAGRNFSVSNFRIFGN